MAEEVKRGVRLDIFSDGIHIDPDPLPGVIVADGGVADALGAGAGHRRPEGPAVAYGTCLAVGSDTGAGIGQNILIGHLVSPSSIIF